MRRIRVGAIVDTRWRRKDGAIDPTAGTNTTPPVVTLYAWNEWTEGGYLEPDTTHGMGYLEAIKRVFR